MVPNVQNEVNKILYENKTIYMPQPTKLIRRSSSKKQNSNLKVISSISKRNIPK